MDKFIEFSEGLLPIINPLDVEGTLYMLRLTPFGKYDRTVIETWLNTFTKNWVVSKENSKKDTEHFYITIYESFEEENLRELIRTFLKIHFPAPPRRGDANKQYNLTIADCIEKAINYTVKELDITYGTNMNPKYMAKRVKASFLKFDKQTFAKKMEDIKQEFKTTDMILPDLMTNIVLLKAEYRQPINMTYVYQLALSCDINKNPKHVRNLVSDYLDRK